MKKIKMFNIVGLGLIAMLILTGCADTSNIDQCLRPSEHTYGFWGGTWHGMIMGLSFIGSLFDNDIAVYAVNNNGGWYDFGFVGGFFFMIRMIGYIIKGITS